MAEGSFNPRPSVRATLQSQTDRRLRYRFNPRPSVRATIACLPFGVNMVFQSTPLREGDIWVYNRVTRLRVSIHAPP